MKAEDAHRIAKRWYREIGTAQAWHEAYGIPDNGGRLQEDGELAVRETLGTHIPDGVAGVGRSADGLPCVLVIADQAVFVVGCTFDQDDQKRQVLARGEFVRIPLDPASVVVRAASTFNGALDARWRETSWEVTIAGTTAFTLMSAAAVDDTTAIVGDDGNDDLVKTLAASIGWLVPGERAERSRKAHFL